MGEPEFSQPLPEIAPGRALILHIGHSKTGSTAIQDALARGLAQVPGRKLLFPGHRNHMPLAKSLGAGPAAASRDERFTRLRERLDREDWDVAVISSEQFEFTPPEAVREAVAQYLGPYLPILKVIVYVRPHVSRLVANHAERLKLGFTFDGLEADLEVQCRRRLLFYAERLSRWRLVFGERLLVRPFLPGALFRGDVVADFFRLAFGSDAVELALTESVNQSLSMQDLSVFREMHMRIHARNPDILPQQQAWAWDAAGFLGALPPVAEPVRPAIDRELLKKTQSLFAEDAAAFDRLFWGRPLFAEALETAEAVAAPLPVEAEAWHGPETRRLIHGWADMMAHLLEAGPMPVLRAIQPDWAR